MPNIKFDDDFMFPVSTQGMKKAGMILESAEPSDTDQDQVTDLARTQARINAMTAVLQWVSLEDYSYNALDELVLVVADLDGDFEISEEEENAYNAIWAESVFGNSFINNETFQQYACHGYLSHGL